MNKFIFLTEEQADSVIYNATKRALSDSRKHSELIGPEPDTWFDLSELCRYHPDKPAKATVYGWVHQGLIPMHKSAKKLRFLKSEIDEWLRRGRQKTITEIESEAIQNLVKPKRRHL